MSIKINKLEIENVKRVKAVKMEPTATGLTVVGGGNMQGKTSVLDAIAWALGGEKFRPSDPQREGSVVPPYLNVVMSNGLVVERKGKNSELKVIDPTGNKGGQQLLNEFVEQLALDLPKFMQSNNKEKADILLQIIGVGKQLVELERKETELYNQRRTIGQIADQKKKFADEQIYYTDAPRELVSASELIRQQQDILARNGENNRKRQNLKFLEGQAADIQIRINELMEKQKAIQEDLEIARKSALDLHDESTTELESNIRNIDEINRKVRANLDKEKASDDALDYANQYNTLTTKIDEVRKAKTDLLQNANLPLPGLSVIEGELVFNGRKWDCMSAAEQLKVSTAIIRKLNPKCGFVLIDKLEQMDVDTLREFGKWASAEDLQIIGTRVSKGDECAIIIEDGYAVATEKPAEAPAWKRGSF